MQGSDHDASTTRISRKPATGTGSETLTSPSMAPTPDQSGVPPYDDAPPSYEDAIAQDLPPVDGPRRDYAPPPIPEGQSGFPEEKGG